MSWDVTLPSLFLQSLPVSFPSFFAWEEEMALVGSGGLAEVPTDASFSYDDALFGATPDGCYKRMASHVANAPGRAYSAEFVTLPFEPIISVGSDLLAPLADDHSSSLGGTLTAMAVTMDGFGTLDFADSNLSIAAGSAQRVADHLPWTVTDTAPPPGGYLLRPLPLAFPGMDPANDANRILWAPGEIDIVRWTFTVHSFSLRIIMEFDPRAFATTA